MVSGFTLHVTTESLATCVFTNRPSFFQALTCSWGNKVQVTHSAFAHRPWQGQREEKASQKSDHEHLIQEAEDQRSVSWGHLPEARLQWADSRSDRSHQASHHPAGQSLYVGDASPPLLGLLTVTAPRRGSGQSWGEGTELREQGASAQSFSRMWQPWSWGKGCLCFLITESMGLLQGGQWAAFTSNQAALWETHTSTEIAS